MGTNTALRKAALLLVIFCVAEFCADLALAARRRTPPGTDDFLEGPAPRRTRQSRSRDRRGAKEGEQTAVDAADDIASKLEAVLEQVNTGGKLRPQEIDLVKQTLRQARKHLQNFSDEEECEYYLLGAWSNYFTGQYKAAMIEAAKAAKQDPENQDAKASHIAMALLNGQFKVVAGMSKKHAGDTIFGDAARSSRYGRGRSGRSSYFSRATLDFEPDSLRIALLARKLPAMQLNCINTSTFDYNPNQTALCIMFWKLASDQQEEGLGRSRSIDPFGSELFPMMTPTVRTRSRTRTTRRGRIDESSVEMDAFCDLFLASFENPNVRFLGANLDSFESRSRVMATMLENPWPWAQVMTSDPANTIFGKFAELDFRQPALAIVAPGGVICYAGPATGFLPFLLIDYYASCPEATTPAEWREPPGRGDQPLFKEIYDANSPKPLRHNLGKKSTTFDLPTTAGAQTEEEQLNPQAENWYQLARAFKEKSAMLPTVKFGNIVRYCRLILENYPESSYAEKARQMLREIPERHRKRYKITDEEMGL